MPSEPPTIVVLHEETLLRQAMVELLAKIMPYRLLTQVTALPGELSNVLDSGFVCENPDCEAFGEPIDS